MSQRRPGGQEALDGVGIKEDLLCRMRSSTGSGKSHHIAAGGSRPPAIDGTFEICLVAILSRFLVFLIPGDTSISTSQKTEFYVR